MKKLFSFLIFSLFFFCLFSIEVGGHLTADTIWGPENNPYLVIAGIYVDVGVTLTILPGTVVKFNADYYDDLGDDQFYFQNGEEPIAKFIRVEGSIIAEGTEQDSIIFTRMQDEEYYHWGTIYLPEGAQQSSFKHCLFEFAAFTGFSISEQPRAAIAIWNGTAKVNECNFIDNDRALSIEKNVIDIMIRNSNFDYSEYFHPNIMNNCGNSFIMIRYIFGIDEGKPLITGNTFIHGKALHTSKSVSFVANNIDMVPYSRVAIHIACEYGESYCYNNFFGSCSKGIDAGLNNTECLYIKNNYFSTNGGDGINIDDAYVEISDNYFEGCDLDTGLDSSGKVFNNIIDDGKVRTSGYLEVYNNIGYNGSSGLIVTYRNEVCNNNLSVSNQYAFDGAFSSFFNNCLFIANEEISNNGVSGNPIFRNCILDFELPPECIDGGGNIWVDSLQAQTLFEDIQSGDFHLIEGSLAIDAGFDTLGFYYPFDMDYNHRVWDGDNNGTAIIDIGPYEYNSPSFGGIEGYTFNPTTGEPVDYVLLKIDNQPGEFTFSDSVGNFQYKLPAGIYDVYAERVFYDDVIEYDVEVFDEQFTQVLIPMTETVDVENIQYSIYNFQLRNYPNPFNPTTTISFSLINDSDVEISVYNIKGQKVKTLINKQMLKGKHSVIWAGIDDSNKPVSSGIYLYSIKADNQESVNRMLLLK